MGLCLGETRVDLAVVNGHLHGYEIKSERDTLARLASQIGLYDRVLDYSTIVCSQRHIANVIERIPDHWGVIEAADTNMGVKLRAMRAACINRSVEPIAVAQLLWRDEAAEILAGLGGVVRRRGDQMGSVGPARASPAPHTSRSCSPNA